MTTPVALVDRYIARIIGTLDATDLVPIEPMHVQPKAQQESKAAMETLLNTTMLDFYLLRSRGASTNSVRWQNVPFGTTGIVISQNANQDYSETFVSVWIDKDPDYILAVQERSDLSAPLLSSVVPALHFRRIFGSAARKLVLPTELGSLTFTPTAIEVGWRPAQPSGAGDPWFRFDYNDPGLANYVDIADGDDDYGVWLWFTDKATNQPEQEWHKVSLISRQLTDPPSARVDDPREEPPRRPPLLS